MKGPTWHCIVGRNFGSFVTHGMLLRLSQPCYTSRLCRALRPSSTKSKLQIQLTSRPRNKALHIFLPRTLRHPSLQDPINIFHTICHDIPRFLLYERCENGQASGVHSGKHMPRVQTGDEYGWVGCLLLDLGPRGLETLRVLYDVTKPLVF